MDNQSRRDWVRWEGEMTGANGVGMRRVGGVVVGFAVAAVSVVGLTAVRGILPDSGSVHGFLGSSFDSQLLDELLEGALWLLWRKCGKRRRRSTLTGEERMGMRTGTGPGAEILRRCLPPMVWIAITVSALGVAQAPLAAQAALDRRAGLNVEGAGVEQALRLLR
ncbi:MAG: hypothetical protein P8099_11100, partial [Gemmatimonadota bacterium]